MGLIYLLGYIVVVGFGTFLMKFVQKDITPYQVNFLIAVGMLVITVPLLLLTQKTLAIPAGKSLPFAVAAGLGMAVGSILFVLSLSKVPVGTASAIASGYIVFALVLSAVFLKEPLDAAKIIGIVLTLAGITILSLKTG